MARGISIQDSSKYSKIIPFLQKIPLLSGLSARELSVLSRYCAKTEIPVSEIRMPLNYFHNRVVFIVEGVFEKVYYSDENARLDPNMATVVRELRPGDVWGSHFLYTDNVVGMEKIGLRALDKGELVYLSASAFGKYLEKQIDLQRAFDSLLLEESIQYFIGLGGALAKLNQTELVLNRIESVADLLMDSVLAKGEQKRVIQKKYLCASSPNTTFVKSMKIEIEQAFLSISDNKEDRIRREGDNYYRTTKFGSGIQRSSYNREITQVEYSSLMHKKQGSIISKDREYLSDDYNGGKIAIDRFKYGLQGLVIVEVDFASHDAASQFVLPDFLQKVSSKDITEDNNYMNQSLALHGLPASS